jgi:hypothetical protein
VEHDHVLLAEPGGSPSERVPATPVGDSEWLVLGTPGVVNGCAAGDRVLVGADGTFRIVERGGNVAAHVYSRNAMPETDPETLRDSFASCGGLVEWPSSRRFAVVTVSVEAGFPTIEQLMSDFVANCDDFEWFFGNVHDAEGQPLNWW